MAVTVLIGALVTLALWGILHPFATGRGRELTATETTADADEELRRSLLRQLQDVDEDLACGKLDHDDHRRLRAPLERRTAAVLRRLEDRRPPTPPGPATADAPQPRTEPTTRHRRRTRVLAVTTATAGLAVVGLILNGALAPRGGSATLTGDNPAAVSSPAPDGTRARGLAAVDAAVQRVRRNPKDIQAHLDLARAYATAGNAQLATIEYLAVTKLDRANAEAGTALAMVAFAARRPRQAERLVDIALAAHPRYPDALYARGLIRLMGLGHPAAARRDLRGYLAAAPFGSHRTTVQTLLAMSSGRGPK